MRGAKPPSAQSATGGAGCWRGSATHGCRRAHTWAKFYHVHYVHYVLYTLLVINIIEFETCDFFRIICQHADGFLPSPPLAALKCRAQICPVSTPAGWRWSGAWITRATVTPVGDHPFSHASKGCQRTVTIRLPPGGSCHWVSQRGG